MTNVPTYATMSTTTTILVADDDALLRDLVEHRLEAKGYTVVTAVDGREAVDLARTRAPDLVVLDAMMPVMDGFAVLSALKGDPSTSAIPVVMLSALRSDRDVVGALDQGADDYLVKPFMPDELISRIGRILKMQRP